MNDKQHILKNTTTLVIVALLIVAASVSMVVYADDSDYDVVEYDIDEMDDPDVPYKSLVEITGDGIDNEDEFVLYKDGDRTEFTYSADEDDTVTVDTGEFEDNPRETYTLADAPEGMLTVDGTYDETEEDNNLIIEQAHANVDYIVTVQENDENGDVLGSEEFDAGTELVEYELSTDEIDDESDIYVSVSEQDGDELDSETVTVSYEGEHEGANDENLDEFDRLTADFTVVEEETGDVRVEHDVLGGEPTTLDRVWVGQELVLADDDWDSDVTYDLMKEDGDDSTLVREITAEESDTVNDYEINIDTTLSGSDLEAEGDFYIDGPNGVEVEWNAMEQDLDSELNESIINLHTDNTEVDLNLTSIRSGPYDVLVEAEDVDADELVDLVDESELPSNSEVHVEDAHDEDNEQMRVVNVSTSSDNVFTVPLDFDGAEEMEYEFDLSVADSTAESTTDGINVQFFDEGEATFSQGTYTQNQGDMVEFTIDMSDTSVATLKFAEDDYDLEFDVEDTDNSGDAVIRMDTYLAGDHSDKNVSDVFEPADGTDIDYGSDDLPAVSGPFDTGLYTMELNVNDRDTDMATLWLTERESDNINTWVMPHDKDATLSDLEEYGTQQDNVAMQDMFVVEVEASGLYSNSLITADADSSELVDENTTAEDLIDHHEREDVTESGLSEFGLNIETRQADRHDMNTQLLLEHASELEVVPEENKFYVFFDTSNDEIFNNFDNDFENKTLSEFDINFNVSEDYKYVDEDDESANLHETFEFVERDIVTTLPSVTVDEETLETKHGLAAVENSTVSGHTYIAPYTDDIDIVVRTEGAEEHETESEFFSERVEVDEDNTVSAQFNLSHIDVDRAMELQYRPIDDDYRQAVMMDQAEPPEITEFSSDDTPVTEGEEVGFNLDIDADDVDSLNYEWDFDDGETSSQSDPAHVYDEAGTYNVEVTVTDSSNQSDTAETEIVVEEAPNEPPTIEQIIAPEDGEVGEELSFAVVAFDEDDQEDLEYAWDFDDGSTSSGISATHTYDNEGTYDVEVTVTDTEGESTTEETIVEITDSSAEEEEEDESHELTMMSVDAESNDIVPGVSISIMQDGEEVESTSADGDGEATVELEDGEYDIEANVEGYETLETGTFIDGEDSEMDLQMVQEASDDDEDPSQPGFTFVLAAIAMLAGSLIAYRRKAN